MSYCIKWLFTCSSSYLQLQKAAAAANSNTFSCNMSTLMFVMENWLLCKGLKIVFEWTTMGCSSLQH